MGSGEGGEESRMETVYEDPSPLFEPFTWRGKTLRNRIVMPPMVVLRGLGTEDGIAWYGEHARGGVGLVIVEATGVTGFAEEQPEEGLRALVDAIHAGGALAAIQLFPGVFGQSVTPADLSLERIAELLDEYERAAEICARVGFDGLEPHGAHGYLLNQFFSPERNERDDAYGGSSGNRMRLGLEVVARLRAITEPAGMWLLYRHTPVGPGYGIPESLDYARELVAAGVDILDISPASDQAPGDLSAPFTDLGVPVIAVNEMHKLDRALEVLREGRGQLIAVARQLIADPEWPNKVREGMLEQSRACASCNGCFADLRERIAVGCRRQRSAAVPS